MATIELFCDKTYKMTSMYEGIKWAVDNFNYELTMLQQDVGHVNESVCDLSEIESLIQTTTQIQEEKMDALQTFSDSTEMFIELVDKIDEEAAALIDQNKKDFYEKYSYLKPDSEKNIFEHIGDGIVAIGDWIIENWEALLVIVLTVIAVVIVVAISVATFGAGTVLLAAAAGAAYGVGSQFVGDVVNYAVTGEWSGSWQDYLGAAFGGALGGVLSLGGASFFAGISTFASDRLSDAATSLFSQSLTSLTTDDKMSMSDILLGTTVEVTAGAMLDAIDINLGNKVNNQFGGDFDSLSDRLTSNFTEGLGNTFESLGNKFPALNGFLDNFTGVESLKDSYNYMLDFVLGQPANVMSGSTIGKTIGQGFVSEMYDNFLMDAIGGVFDDPEEIAKWASVLHGAGYY